jgi:hypothetical protein
MDERVSGLTASGHRMAESLGREVTMFDQQGIWAMNQAHHRELLEVAAKHRLLKTIRERRPVMLEALRNIVPMIGIGIRVVRRRRQMQVEQGFAQ